MRSLAVNTLPPIQSTPPLLSPAPLPPAAQLQQRSSPSLNVLSFGFLATAVLLSVFLVVAVFERFLHRPGPPSSSSSFSSALPTSATVNAAFVGQASAVASFSEDMGMILPKKRPLVGLSVLMPGQDVPTFIACPAPITCSRETHDDGDHNVGHNPT